MSETSKSLGQYDMPVSIRAVYNNVDASLTTAGFLTGLIGRKVTQAISTTSTSNDTLTFTYSESGTTLYAIKVIYTDSTYATFISAERIS